MRLREKESQARTALNLALNLSLQASLVSPPGSTTPPAPEKIRWPQFHRDRKSPSA